MQSQKKALPSPSTIVRRGVIQKAESGSKMTFKVFTVHQLSPYVDPLDIVIETQQCRLRQDWMCTRSSGPPLPPHGDDDRDATHQDNVPPRPRLRFRPSATHLILPMRLTSRQVQLIQLPTSWSDLARDASTCCQLHSALCDYSSTCRHTSDRARRACTCDWIHCTSTTSDLFYAEPAVSRLHHGCCHHWCQP